MTVAEKLVDKLSNGTINAKELRTLLKQKKWRLLRFKGSHEIWCNGMRTFVLATHSKELKPYQIKEAQLCLLEQGVENEKKEF